MRQARFYATRTRARKLGDGRLSGLPTIRLLSIAATSAHSFGAHNIGTDKPTEVGRSNEIDDANEAPAPNPLTSRATPRVTTGHDSV